MDRQPRAVPVQLQDRQLARAAHKRAQGLEETREDPNLMGQPAGPETNPQLIQSQTAIWVTKAEVLRDLPATWEARVGQEAPLQTQPINRTGLPARRTPVPGLQ